jgi:hypothetical protein
MWGVLLGAALLQTGSSKPATPPQGRATGTVIQAAPPKLPPLLPPGPAYRAPIGETLVYAAQWRVFPAGIATLRVEQAGQEIRVVGTADASGAVGLLFHVHDRFESFVDPASFCSRSLSKNNEEGFRRVSTSITYDYQRHKAIVDHKNLKKNESRHVESEIPGCVSDVLSAIYYVSSLPLLPGRTYSFPVNDGGKTVPVDIHVEAREQIKTPAGTYNTIRVQPDAPADVFKDKPKMWIWYTDNAAHTPVQMRMHMRWGMFTLSLQRIDRK